MKIKDWILLNYLMKLIKIFNSNLLINDFFDVFFDLNFISVKF